MYVFRLFVTNEYSVYRTLAYWLFMQLNPHIQLMTTHSWLILYFITQLNMTLIWIKYGHVVAPKLFLLWNFRKEL